MDAQRAHAPVPAKGRRWKQKLVPKNPGAIYVARTELAGPMHVTPWLQYPKATELDADYLHRSDRGAFLAFARYMTHGHLTIAQKRQERLKAHSPMGLWSETKPDPNLAPHLQRRFKAMRARRG